MGVAGTANFLMGIKFAPSALSNWGDWLASAIFEIPAIHFVVDPTRSCSHSEGGSPSPLGGSLSPLAVAVGESGQLRLALPGLSGQHRRQLPLGRSR